MTREEYDDKFYKMHNERGDYQSSMYVCIEYIDSLEQQNTALQARIKELEDHKTCDGCEYSEYNYAHKCETCDRTIRNDYFTPKNKQ